MKTKIVALLVILLFTFITILPTTVAEDEYKQSGIFTYMTHYLQLGFNENDTMDPIIPRGEIRSVNISIQYGVNFGGLFGGLSRLKFAFQKGKQAGFVKINASVYPIKSLFGLRTIISGFQNELTIEFTPAYLPLIKTEIPSQDQIIIKPYNETRIPINITNLGNARTNVIAVIENASESWDVSISNVLIDVGDTEQTFLIVTADHKFKEKEIKLKFIPFRAEDVTDTGDPEIVTIILINDGSYKEESDIDIDTNLLFGIIFIIILFLILLLIIKKRKK